MKYYNIDNLLFTVVCEVCGYEFNIDNFSPKNFWPHEEEQNYDDYDDDMFIKVPMMTHKDNEPKVIEAVEKPMNDAELISYYKKYISVLKEQRQQKQLLTKTKLHEIILQLYRSLQYKHEQPEGTSLHFQTEEQVKKKSLLFVGQINFRYCQVCYDKSEPVIKMNV